MSHGTYSASYPQQPARLRVVGGHGGAVASEPRQEETVGQESEDRFRGLRLVNEPALQPKVERLPSEPRVAALLSSYEQSRRIVEQVQREIEQRLERERLMWMATEAEAAEQAQAPATVWNIWCERLRRLSRSGELAAAQL